MLASATEKLTIYDQKGDVLSESKPFKYYLWGVDWSPDGSTIVTSSRDGLVTLWNNKAEQIKVAEF
jgi:WD40 repeat protein